MKRKRSSAGWSYLLLMLNALACGVPDPPQVVTITQPPVFRPSNPEEVKTPDQAMAAIITVCKKDLDLPTVEPLSLHLYKDTRAFTAHVYGWKTLPFEVAHIFAAAEKNKIHINMGWRNEISLRDQEIPWDSLLSVLAHEYGHTVEYVLASDNTYAATWIREGFADWVAAKVMHFLGWYEYAGSLHRARQELLRHKDLLPELSLLEIDRYWDGFSKKPKGSIRTYRYAFMAVDGLIQKKGLKSLIGYLQSGRFQDSFGFSLSDFEAELRHDLFNVAPMIHEKFKIQKPDWKIGYKWTYVRKRPGSKETVVREIVREDVFEGFPSFVMRTGKDENFYN